MDDVVKSLLELTNRQQLEIARLTDIVLKLQGIGPQEATARQVRDALKPIPGSTNWKDFKSGMEQKTRVDNEARRKYWEKQAEGAQHELESDTGNGSTYGNDSQENIKKSEQKQDVH